MSGKIYDDLDQDLQEIWAVQGVYPNMDWTPDGRTLVFWAGGKIRRINVSSGEHSVIPFSVNDVRAVVESPRPDVAVAPDEFQTKLARFASVSPDGRRVVFETLGKLYVKSLPNGAPRRLTNSANGDFEFFPSWSYDGRRIVYVSWNDETLGTIRTVSSSGGSGRAITSDPGHYRRPRFSPNGRSVVFEKGSGGYLTSKDWSEAPGVYIISASGGDIERVTKSGAAPHFGASNDRIFMTTVDGINASLISVDLDGDDERTHAAGDLITGYQVAPSGNHLAFSENYNAFVMPMTPGPQKIAAGRKASAVPVTKASGIGAAYMNWSRNQLNWSLGPVLYHAGVDEMLATQPKSEDDEGDTGYTPPDSGVDLSLSVAADKPAGLVALTNARVITMASDDGGVIENGLIVLDGNRIQSVGDDVMRGQFQMVQRLWIWPVRQSCPV